MPKFGHKWRTDTARQEWGGETMVNCRNRAPRSSWRQWGIAVVVATAVSACGNHPTILDMSEDEVGIKTNWAGADHREFHRVLHYPTGVGLQFPGYVVGIEKAHQTKIGGPATDSTLLDMPGPDARSGIQRKLLIDPKSHFVSHVMHYRNPGNDDAVHPHRIRSCAVYAVLPPADPVSHEAGGQLYPPCDETRTPKPSEAYANGWTGLARLKTLLKDDLTPRSQRNGDERATEPPNHQFSHIFVVVMGWNTPQGEAIQNFNSIIGRLLNDVDERRGNMNCAMDSARQPECNFNPLVIGVTWASDWQLSALLPLPPALVRLISFPNKANDAKELGMTWLRAVIQHVVLPVRDKAGRKDKPKIVLIGHSFGARALMSALTDEEALNLDRATAEGLPQHKEFRPGDLFIALQGAFEVEDLFKGQDPNKGLHDSIANGNLRVIMTSSEFDAAVETAFWDTYAASWRGYAKLCGDESNDRFSAFVDCRRLSRLSTANRYAFSACARPEKNGDIPDRINDRSVLYLNASAVVNCRAAFTGGGAHSDIYRREMARLLWDHIR